MQNENELKSKQGTGPGNDQKSPAAGATGGAPKPLANQSSGEQSGGDGGEQKAPEQKLKKVKLLKPHTHAGTNYVVDDEIEVNEADELWLREQNIIA